MKKRTIMAVAMAMVLATGIAGTTAFVSMAAPYTQADTPDQVNYGTLSQQELDIVYKYFDPEYYGAKYEDVSSRFGSDEALLLEHFVKCGIFEGREGWPTFNASAYSSAYPELKDRFGHDIVKYFVHFYTKGINEGRTLTTIKGCEDAGITVISLFDEDDFVTTEIYAASNLMGTNDYNTVKKAADAASSNGAAVVNTDDTTYVVVDEETAKKLAKDDPNYEKIGTFSVGTDRECAILVYKKGTGYGTKIVYNFDSDIIDSGILPTSIVGAIPMAVFTVDEANAIINGEQYEIETFDVAQGTVVGTEGVVYTQENGLIYLQPSEFETPGKRNMTNYVGGEVGYIDNAYVGVDEKGTAATEYEIGTVTRVDENGDAQVTAVISNEETGFNYEVTYTFDGEGYDVQPSDE